MEVTGDIAVIRIDHPPVNALDHATRERLVHALQAALANEAVRGIVLAGSDKAFSAGADVGEFGTPKQLQEPTLRTLLAVVEGSRKPVVAALAGTVLGGGVELALACHGRVAHEAARVGLPEINLGLIPGSGGTQRLPRLVGMETAHAMMSGGQARSARELADSGLLDAVVADSAIDAAAARAHALARQGEPFPRARNVGMAADGVAAFIAGQRDKLTKRQRMQPAYAALLDALAATVLPFDEGLRKERELFLALVGTTAAQALRYQFKAEREATRLPAALQAQPRTIRKVGIVGAGTMGCGIAIAALESGFDVHLLEQDEQALERGRRRILDHFQTRVAAGKLRPDAAASNQSRLSAGVMWNRLGEADLVIEAVFEDLAVKKQVFRRIDQHAAPGALLATNTSYLDVDAIAAATSRPQDVLGLHFFSPAHVMKLLEVVRGEKTAADVMASGMAFGSALKKVPVPSGNAFGFIGNRIYNAYRRECEFMLEDGAWPEEVDDALTAFGFAMGPFAVADLSGLDIAWRMRKAQAAARDPRERYVAILDRLCEMGRLGRKTGAGYYAYPDGVQSKATDQEVREVIEAASRQRGVARRKLDPTVIQRRALLAMVNEAALLLAQGIAARASDVDVVLVQGYGFPRWEGGPVFWARRQNPIDLHEGLRQIAAHSGHGFVLADLGALLAS